MIRVQPANNTQGFSLIEILIALSISIILFMWVFPVKQDFFLKNKLLARTEEIVSALHYARSQAALLEEPLILAPLAPNINNSWSDGIVLFLDRNGNHLYESADTLLFQWQWQGKDLKLLWSGLYSHYLLFMPTEQKSVLGGAFYLCPEEKNSTVKGRKISMNRLGRIRVEESEEICHTESE